MFIFVFERLTNLTWYGQDGAPLKIMYFPVNKFWTFKLVENVKGREAKINGQSRSTLRDPIPITTICMDDQ